ncbi:MAG: hypothetical protein PF590_03035, partial [Candidatus Delongbacteria bacterium]|nr:hypothetical protein [Candidatus Delongbacteria bacterium]
FLISCFKFFCIIPIVLQKFALSMKNAENLDAKELLEVPLSMFNTENSVFERDLFRSGYSAPGRSRKASRW